MHPDIERVLITEGELREKVKQAAEMAAARYRGSNPVVIGILKGSIVFYSDFIRNLDIPVTLDFMAVSSYGSGSSSSGQLRMKKDVDTDVKGRDIVIVEDIIDSGLTLMEVKKMFYARGANSVYIVTLLNKRGRREYDIEPDYNCFDIENEFVVGYGLDYNERYRNLPYVGVLKPSVYQK